MLEGLNEILHKNLEVLSVQYLFILTSVTVFIIVFLHLIMSTLHTKNIWWVLTAIKNNVYIF